ncbi:MAG: helix-turn-helix transcriptional regulator [Mycobacteriaceae bacterium]|nr:helix-turn-helix transcriptional regulator [Mycobacteriaceae bacterium]
MQNLLQCLRKERLRRHVSQADVAARIGTTQSAIARFESGLSDPRLSTMERYADAIGVEFTIRAVADRSTLRMVAVDVRQSLDTAGASESLRQVIQFVDDTARLEAAEVSTRIREEPDSVGDSRWDALLAGIAEYVGRRAGVATPGWASAPGRFLHRFWFVIEDVLSRPAPGLAAHSFVSSPPELAARGVFLDRASLVSV